jgi:mannose-6-phosphate isomerase-like protein (cupin superfamily)
MKRKTLELSEEFKILLKGDTSQAAEMVLKTGDVEGGPDNIHKGSDQWLFIVSGSGMAKINGRHVPLRQNDLVLIEKGDVHEIRNTGRKPLCTLNFYVPPAYKANGDPLPSGSSLDFQSANYLWD